MRVISIRAFDKNTKEKRGYRILQGLLSLRISELDYCPYGQGAKDPAAIWKVVIRSSNSVYYPNITNSLYLPDVKSEILFSDEEIEFIKKKPADIEKLITNNFEQKSEEGLAEALEADYRRS